MKMMLFQSCQVGKSQGQWEHSLPGAKVEAWDKNVMNGEMMYYNINDNKLESLIENTLGGSFAKEVYTPPSGVAGAVGSVAGLAAGLGLGLGIGQAKAKQK